MMMMMHEMQSLRQNLDLHFITCNAHKKTNSTRVKLFDIILLFASFLHQFQALQGRP